MLYATGVMWNSKNANTSSLRASKWRMGDTRYHCLGMNIMNHCRRIGSLVSNDYMDSYIEVSKTLKCCWNMMPKFENSWKMELLRVQRTEKVHYLPHHTVIRRDKDTTKVRVVYDASSRSIGPSLNSCLHTGPKFYQKILEILLRFRSYPIALVADIKKAFFLMISVDLKDRDVLHFLWVKDVYAEEPEIIPLRFAKVGVFWSLFTECYDWSSCKAVHRSPARPHWEIDDLCSQWSSRWRSIWVLSRIQGDATGWLIRPEKICDKLHFLAGEDRSKGGQDPVKACSQFEFPQNRAINFDESYVESTMLITIVTTNGKQRVLSIHWNTVTDRLVFWYSTFEKLPRLREI